MFRYKFKVENISKVTFVKSDYGLINIRENSFEIGSITEIRQNKIIFEHSKGKSEILFNGKPGSYTLVVDGKNVVIKSNNANNFLVENDDFLKLFSENINEEITDPFSDMPKDYSTYSDDFWNNESAFTRKDDNEDFNKSDEEEFQKAIDFSQKQNKKPFFEEFNGVFDKNFNEKFKKYFDDDFDKEEIDSNNILLGNDENNILEIDEDLQKAIELSRLENEKEELYPEEEDEDLQKAIELSRLENEKEELYLEEEDEDLQKAIELSRLENEKKELFLKENKDLRRAIDLSCNGKGKEELYPEEDEDLQKAIELSRLESNSQNKKFSDEYEKCYQKLLYIKKKERKAIENLGSWCQINQIDKTINLLKLGMSKFQEKIFKKNAALFFGNGFTFKQFSQMPKTFYQNYSLEAKIKKNAEMAALCDFKKNEN